MSFKKQQANERHVREQEQYKKCLTLANERFSEIEFDKIKVANKGLYFFPVMDRERKIQKMALMKPIIPSVFKICQKAFVKAAMRECFVGGDKEIFEEEEYFNQAWITFLEILEGETIATAVEK